MATSAEVAPIAGSRRRGMSIAVIDRIHCGPLSGRAQRRPRPGNHKKGELKCILSASCHLVWESGFSRVRYCSTIDQWVYSWRRSWASPAWWSSPRFAGATRSTLDARGHRSAAGARSPPLVSPSSRCLPPPIAALRRGGPRPFALRRKEEQGRESVHSPVHRLAAFVLSRRCPPGSWAGPACRDRRLSGCGSRGGAAGPR